MRTILPAALAAATLAQAASVQPLACRYRSDVRFPEYYPFWRESWSLKNLDGETLQYAYKNAPVAGSVHLFLRNTADKPRAVDDMRFEGISLRRAVAFSKQTRKRGYHPASIYFAGLTDAERKRLKAAGSPIWWRVDPNPIPAGGTAEAIVRLRRTPALDRVCVAVQCAGESIEATAPVLADHPRVLSMSFSPGLDRVLGYFTAGGKAPQKPVKVLWDGADATARAAIAFDERCPVSVVSLPLASPVERGSYHCIDARYPHGRAAAAGLRAWRSEFAYGIWGYGRAKEGDHAAIQRYVRDWAEHNMNAHMGMNGRALNEFLKSDDGPAAYAKLGIRHMPRGPGRWRNPLAYFLMDEPDCGDYRVGALAPRLRVGSLAQALVKLSREYRRQDPATPHFLNVDLTFKPDNWYIYGQLPDVFASDPYYQERLKDAYWSHPERLPLYTKATYVYAIARVSRSACAPKPYHVILNSVRRTTRTRRFRFAAPEEKRIEAYYALAAGARGFSYWWYTPIGECYGCGAKEPEAQALWREIGLVGGELRSIGDVILDSCPAALPVAAPKRVWVRCLLSGLDTVVVVCVTDAYASDRVGALVQPIENARVRVTLPSWLKPERAFEATPQGPQDVDCRFRGQEAALALGTLNVTRLILITRDPGLRGRVQKLYDERLAKNCARLAPVPTQDP